MKTKKASKLVLTSVWPSLFLVMVVFPHCIKIYNIWGIYGPHRERVEERMRERLDHGLSWRYHSGPWMWMRQNPGKILVTMVSRWYLTQDLPHAKTGPTAAQWYCSQAVTITRIYRYLLYIFISSSFKNNKYYHLRVVSEGQTR